MPLILFCLKINFNYCLKMKNLIIFCCVAVIFQGVDCKVKDLLIRRATILEESINNCLPLVKSHPEISTRLAADKSILVGLLKNLNLANETQVIYRLEYELISVEKTLIEKVHEAYKISEPEIDRLHELLESCNWLFVQAAKYKPKLEAYAPTVEKARTLLKAITEQDAALKELVHQMKEVTINKVELLRLEKEVFARIKPFAEKIGGAIMGCCSTPKPR